MKMYSVIVGISNQLCSRSFYATFVRWVYYNNVSVATTTMSSQRPTRSRPCAHVARSCGMGTDARYHRQQSKHLVWRRNPWKVRRQRYMYDMLGLIKQHKVDEAHDVFERMKSKRISPDTAMFNVLIGVYGRKGELRKAFKLFNDLKKRRLIPSHHTYTSIFTACAVAGAPQGTEVLAKVEEEVDRRNVLLNDISYNALMMALVKCGQPERAFEVYSSMLRLNVQPSVETFSTLLLAASKDSQDGIKSTMRIWREMKAVRIQPDAQCCASLLVCLRDGGASSVLEPCTHTTLVPPLSQITGDTKPLSLLANGYFTITLEQGVNFKIFVSRHSKRWMETTDLDILLSYMKETEEIRFNIQLLQLLGWLVADVEYLWKTMEGFGVKADSRCIAAAVKQKVLLGDVASSKLLMKRLQDDDRTASVEVEEKGYQAIAATCHSPEDAVQLLEEMKHRNIAPNLQIFEQLIVNAAKHRQYDYLVKLMKLMRRHEVAPNQFIINVLEELASHTHAKSWAQRKQNGFKGYYSLWKNTMDDQQTAI